MMTPPMNKMTLKRNYEWVKNDALYGFTDKTRSSEPAYLVVAHIHFTYSREPKTQSGGGKKKSKD